ncbi:MAG: hypothetical protein ACFFA5_06020 [Promethearchaeota archaeon]
MLEYQQPIHYKDLYKEIKDFIQGNTTLSTLKDFFSVYWNSAHSNKNIDDEIIAKAEILNIAVEAYENGDFGIDDLHKILSNYAPTP